MQANQTSAGEVLTADREGWMRGVKEAAKTAEQRWAYGLDPIKTPAAI